MRDLSDIHTITISESQTAPRFSSEILVSEKEWTGVQSTMTIRTSISTKVSINLNSLLSSVLRGHQRETTVTLQMCTETPKHQSTNRSLNIRVYRNPLFFLQKVFGSGRPSWRGSMSHRERDINKRESSNVVNLNFRY